MEKQLSFFSKPPERKALPLVTKRIPPPRKQKKKDFSQDYWKDRGFCGTQKLTDSIQL